MPLTSEETTNKIDIFLNQVSQKYLMKAEQSSSIESPVGQANIKEKFKKLIFAETKEYAETVGTLVPTDLILEAQQLRLLRIGMEIDSSNNSKTRIGLDCFQELSQVLSISSVSKGLEHKLAYVALAYYLSNGGKEQEALDYFIKVRNVFKEGGFLPFNILEPSFVKLYYSFCIILSSWRSQNTEAHTAYDDLPLSDRLGNGTCELVIDMAVRAVSDMPWIDLQDKIAIITAYQMLSAKCYAEEQFCDPIYLKKAVDFATTSVEQIMTLKNLIAMGHKYGETKEARQRASKEMMALLFPETAAREAARQAEREAFIKEAKQRLEYLDEFLKNSLKQSEEYRKTAEQHARNVINDWAVAAKKEANHRSYQNLKIKGAVMAATYVLVPYVAPVIAPAISGIAGGLGVSAAAATTIGTTLAPAISKAVISTTLDAMVNDDYKHLGKNILKSAAINAVPAGAGLIVNVGDASTKAVEMMKQAAVNMSKGATEAAFNHGNILQGTFIAAASGAVSDKISKALPTEVSHIAALEPAIFSGVQEATTSLVTGTGDPLIGGLHKAAETFVINQMGNSLRAGITVALPPINNPTNAAFHKVKEKSDKEILADENSTKTKQQNVGRKKLSSSKLRAEDQPQSSNQSSSSTTYLSKISRVPSTLSQLDERAAHRQANNLRWLEQLELFSGGLDHFTSQGQASSSRGILNLYQQHQIGTRGMGEVQAAYGASHMGLSVALVGTGNVNRSSISGGWIGGYKINLPEIEHPCASAFRPNLSIEDGVHNNYPVSENIDRGFKFLHGFGKGVAINTVTTAACSIPVVGGVLLTAGGGLIYGHAASMATKFEQDNFTLTREHRDIMRNPLLSDAEKQKHLQDAQVRYEQAKQQRLNAGGVVTRVKNMWEQHPEGLGNSIGLFFGFGRLGPTGSGVCASTILPIKPQLPFKFGWSKQQHSHILEKKFNIPPGKEHCDFITGHGGVHGYENFANARATANFRANLGDDAVPFLQKIGPHGNNVYTGMRSLDKNKGWRLDFDPNDLSKGVHINWWHLSKDMKVYKGMIKIDRMDENLYWDVLSHFPRIRSTIGEKL